MKELEERGVPTVSLVADHFVADFRRSAETLGIPALPLARMPFPFVNQTEAFIHEMVDGGADDIVAGLTRPPAAPEGSVAVTVFPDRWLTFEGRGELDALDRMNAAFLEWQYGDGFPLRPATRESVERMLSGTTRDPDEVLGLLEPGNGVATVEKVAINAVMAGCEPRHLLIVIAALECLIDHQMGLKRKVISTAPSAPLLVVNGPARKAAGLNLGPCQLGPGSPSHSNIVIGRAVRLSLMNVGHTFAGISEMDTIGSPSKFSMCVGENEESSPWSPYHVDHGLAATDSAVTVQFLYGFSDLQDFKSTEPEVAVRKFATGATYMGVNSAGHWLTGHRQDPLHGNVEQEHHLLLIAPEHTKIFSRAGWSKADISKGVHRHARLPFGVLSARLEEGAIRAGRPDLAWLWDSPEALVPILEDPGCYDIVVAGSTGSNRSAYAWGMGGPVTKKIRQEDLDLIG
ncbi:MAG: hypothetical protein KGJ98_00290 [Chloroflexota bacterium]|nr:hypothetical protein [Chloroflexota bacterium]